MVEPAWNIDEQVETYKADGAICTKGLITRADAEQLFSEVLQYQSRKASVDAYGSDMNLSDELPSYWGCVTPLVPVAKSLMGSREVRFYNDHLFVKAAGASAPTDWHQDLPYWPFSGEQIVAAWIALTPVRIQASALHYLKGSHKSGKRYRPLEVVASDPKHPDFLAMEICPNFFEADARGDRELIAWDMEPGDVLWHNGHTAHGAEANRADNPLRAGLTVRFLGDDVTWDPKPYLRSSEDDRGLQNGQAINTSDAFKLLSGRHDQEPAPS